MNMRSDPGFPIRLDRFGTAPQRAASVAIAIPARNEAERIVPCLAGLAAQAGAENESIAVVVLLNNCTDGTLAAIAARSPELPFPVLAASVELPAGFANAGWARRLAMEQAADLLGNDGLLLTTDADSVAFPDWTAQNRREFGGAVDVVAGYVTADWSELSRFPQEILAQGALEWEYQGLAAELEAKADPQAHDPWPRHNQNCGASLAIKAGLYRSLGGLPPVPVGEDRALCDAVRAVDGKLRHSLAAHVTASARTVGRASGGMADALRSRGTDAYLCDDILEPAIDTLRRNLWRSQARTCWNIRQFGVWLRAKGIAETDGMQNAGSFGQAWKILEAVEPRLARQRLASRDLPLETRRIRQLLARFNHAAPSVRQCILPATLAAATGACSPGRAASVTRASSVQP